MLNRGWDNLPEISKTLYKETYFLEGECYDSWATRVATAYANNAEHAARIKQYITSYWFHPATPISSNAGTTRGLPISCFVRQVEDSKEGIFYSYNEGFWLGSRGTGIGTTWDDVREVGAAVSNIGTSSGVIPFIGVSDRATLAISQGGLRRSSEAVYLSVEHPEIVEFIEMRTPDRDENRRMPNIDHGVLVTDAFMHAVENRESWNLISRKTGAVASTVDAFDLWCKILDVRARLKGEPFIVFIDNMNNNAPIEYKLLNYKIKLSNLCTEIALHTDNDKSNVCVLGSLNLEYYDEFEPALQAVVGDCLDFLDNVRLDFIKQTEGLPEFARARKGAIDDAPLGLGVMGFHGYLQKRMIPWESVTAKSVNKKIFKSIRTAADNHTTEVSSIYNACPTSIAATAVVANSTVTELRYKRNIVNLAIAPTMSISNLCNLASSGIEPTLTNAFTKKLKQGSFPIRNKYLHNYLVETCKTNGYHSDWVDAQWSEIMKDQGSVLKLTWMSDDVKNVFKTAFEIDQNWLVELAADRQPFIDQSQSVNLFFPSGSHVQYLYNVHMRAWKSGMSSLYYLRSSAAHRASSAMNDRKNIAEPDSCLACQ